MSDTPVDSSKRTWLIASTCAGAVGAGFVATPFVSTFQPSERAKAAGAAVEVDISEVKPGEKLTVEWRGKPVWIRRRTTEQVDALKKLDAQLDVVLAMYHDQGLIPVKYMGLEQGVNVTLGLPLVRTSPDHGTEFDIAGRGLADPSSMIAAIRMARQLIP